ncbi:LysR substrate-binding domain-containing protein, partial [Rhizobium johnstonii]
TEEAEQSAVLRDGRADVAFVRLPIEADELNVIPLYEEVSVVVTPTT